MPAVVLTTFMIFSMTSTDSVVELASASWKVIKSRPPSSDGTKPDGLTRNKQNAATQIPANTKIIAQEYRMLRRTPFVYPAVNRSNQRSNHAKNRSTKFFFFF